MIRDQHRLSGKTVTIHPKKEYQDVIKNAHFQIEDYWENVSGRSWMVSEGNPACLVYAIRSVGLPIDNEVIYGKINGFGYLIHINELGDEVNDRQYITI